ncbi:hypothetical protein RvY_16617-2 [Ramazzottius varieornatus]|nr:hypothetical protein RvY_16617-2 [Ramazzottius varieornatus]
MDLSSSSSTMLFSKPRCCIFLLFTCTTLQLLLFRLIEGLTTAPFWSQDVHSSLPFSTYQFSPYLSSLQHSHYEAESAFKAGYAVEETVSRDLVRYDNYTGDVYGIIIDAGSTGTRLSAFRFVKSLRPPYMRLVAECGKHLKPGLSYYAAIPDMVYENVKPLIARALECIPQYLWSKTPLELKATAGLRLLPAYIQERLLDNVKAYLESNSPFVLSHDESISIMEGIDEGLYSWITVNYLLDTLHHKYECDDDLEHEQSFRRMMRKETLKKQTVGTLDLGGGSMQITFVPMYDFTCNNAPKEYLHHVRIFGERLTLYSWSYLGFGLMSARMQMFGFPLETPGEDVQLTNNHLTSPCFHPEVEVKWQHASTDFIVTTPKEAVPDSRFERCYSRAVEIVSLQIHHESEVHKETFYAFSYFYDIAVDAGIIPHVAGGEIKVGVFREKAKQVCDNEKVPDKAFLCMDLSYISALLMDGFGFGEHQDMMLQKKINGVETSWALGAMFHLLNTFHNTSQLELAQRPSYNPDKKSLALR